MLLDLREIIEVPGGEVPFKTELQTGELEFGSVREYRTLPAPLRRAEFSMQPAS